MSSLVLDSDSCRVAAVLTVLFMPILVEPLHHQVVHCHCGLLGVLYSAIMNEGT